MLTALVIVDVLVVEHPDLILEHLQEIDHGAGLFVGPVEGEVESSGRWHKGSQRLVLRRLAFCSARSRDSLRR